MLLRRCNSRCCRLQRCGAAALQLSTTLQRIALRCCTGCCDAATLHRLLQRCSSLRCYKLRRCDAATGRGATSCGAVATGVLRLCGAAAVGVLRLYGAAAARGVATLRRCSSSQCCDAAALQRCGAGAARSAKMLRRCNSSRCYDAAALQLLWLLLFFSFFK